MPAGEARLAEARVRVDVIHTGGSVQAGVGPALVDVELTVAALEAWSAGARIVGHHVVAAAPVAAGRRVAVIVVDLAVLALEAKSAPTHVGPVGVDARAAVDAFGTAGHRTFVHVLLTVGACNSKEDSNSFGQNSFEQGRTRTVTKCIALRC